MRRTMLLLVLTMMVLWFISLQTVVAPETFVQSTITTAAVPTETLDPSILQATQNVLREAEVLDYTPVPTRSPEDYRIVFLFLDGAISDDSPYAPDNLAAYMPVKIAHSWDDVLALDTEHPIEALIVHESAKDIVDYEWTAKAGLRGVVMSTINLYFADLDRLFGRTCRIRTNVKNPFAGTDYWLASYEFAQFTIPEEQQQWYEAKYINCTKFKLKGGMSRSKGGTQLPFDAPDSVKMLAESVKSKIDKVKDAKENFRLRLLSLEQSKSW